MNTQSERPQERTSPSRRKMTPAEAGSKGGRATRDRHGTEFFRKIGSIGGSRSGGPRRHGSPLYDDRSQESGRENENGNGVRAHTGGNGSKPDRTGDR